jgi:hypothetical protein
MGLLAMDSTANTSQATISVVVRPAAALATAWQSMVVLLSTPDGSPPQAPLVLPPASAPTTPWPDGTAPAPTG